MALGHPGTKEEGSGADLLVVLPGKGRGLRVWGFGISRLLSPVRGARVTQKAKSKDQFLQGTLFHPKSILQALPHSGPGISLGGVPQEQRTLTGVIYHHALIPCAFPLCSSSVSGLVIFVY